MLQIDRCSVIRDPHTRDSRGFAFVTMTNVADAEAAIAELNGTEIDGKQVVVEKVPASSCPEYLYAQANRARPRSPTPGRYLGPQKDG